MRDIIRRGGGLHHWHVAVDGLAVRRVQQGILQSPGRQQWFLQILVAAAAAAAADAVVASVVKLQSLSVLVPQFGTHAKRPRRSRQAQTAREWSPNLQPATELPQCHARQTL